MRQLLSDLEREKSVGDLVDDLLAKIERLKDPLYNLQLDKDKEKIKH